MTPNEPASTGQTRYLARPDRRIGYDMTGTGPMSPPRCCGSWPRHSARLDHGPHERNTTMNDAAGLPALDRAPAHQRVRHRAPRRPGAVRHRAGPRLGHRSRLFPRRGDQGAVRPAGPVRDRTAADPDRRAGPARLHGRRRQHGDPFPPAPGPHRRPGRAGSRRHRGQPGRVGHAGLPAARAPRADAPS